MLEQIMKHKNRVLYYIRAHVFILILGLLAGAILGEDPLRDLQMSEGIWFWIGSYFLGVVVLIIAFIINGFRKQVLGKGPAEEE